MTKLRHMTITELAAIADTDPQAKEILEKRRARNAKKNRKAQERRSAKMAEDPAYAAKVIAKRAENYHKRQNKIKAEREVLIERAKTDPDAAMRLEEQRSKSRERYYKNKAAQAGKEIRA